jgi:hypothetical protein
MRLFEEVEQCHDVEQCSVLSVIIGFIFYFRLLGDDVAEVVGNQG